VSIIGKLPFNRTADSIQQCLITHATLSNRTEITENDFRFIDAVAPYMIPFENKHKYAIIKYTQQGLSQKEICDALNKNYLSYRPYISRVEKEFNIALRDRDRVVN
jgi:hypothetical protein